jgi:hypothetical protein
MAPVRSRSSTEIACCDLQPAEIALLAEHMVYERLEERHALGSPEPVTRR